MVNHSEGTQANWDYPRLTRSQLQASYPRLVQQSNKFFGSGAIMNGGCLEPLRFGVVVYTAKPATSCDKSQTHLSFMSGRWMDLRYWTSEGMTLNMKGLRYPEKVEMPSSKRLHGSCWTMERQQPRHERDSVIACSGNTSSDCRPERKEADSLTLQWDGYPP